jgi:hypothetical protein
MWLVLTRAPLPDSPNWPGRRLLAVADAVAWPAGWIALASQLPQPASMLGSMAIALAALSAIGRVHCATWQNRRYHFTTWRWGRFALGLLLIGFVLKVAMQA